MTWNTLSPNPAYLHRLELRSCFILSYYNRSAAIFGYTCHTCNYGNTILMASLQCRLKLDLNPVIPISVQAAQG